MPAQVKKTIDETEYTFGTIRIGEARKMNSAYPDPTDFNVAFIAASLRAGGNAEATSEYVDNLPFYGGYFDALLAGAFEANGLKLASKEKKPATGEDQPAEEPALEVVVAAASTSGTSTGA